MHKFFEIWELSTTTGTIPKRLSLEIRQVNPLNPKIKI